MSARSPQSSRLSARSDHSRSPSRKKYRTLSSRSYVDDSLFDKNNENSNPYGDAPSPQKVASPMSRKSRSHQGPRPVNPFAVRDVDSVVISSTELSRLKSASVVMTEAEKRRVAAKAKAEQDIARAEARKKKERILAMEDERKRKIQLSDLEKEKMDTDAKMVSMARAKLDENLDEVKEMNKMMLYARCVTIRDAQKAEKSLIAKENNEEERRLDMLMEIDRLKALEMYEEREKEREIQRKKGASVITDQIREREKERLDQLEVQDLERQEVLRQIERMKQEEVDAQNARKERGRQMLLEVAKFNEEQITRKQREKDEERAEEAKIQEYIRQRDAEAAGRMEEEERLKAEKEKELAKMRAQQQKASDKQAELDALRAKRAHESYEREWRKKEKAAADRQAAIIQDLHEAREAQRLEKETRMMEQAQLEKADHNRVILVQREYERREREKEEAERERIKRHITGLREQIEQNARERKKARDDYLEEGRLIRKKQAEERRRIEMIKHQKIEELKGSGVPNKYTAELARMKI